MHNFMARLPMGMKLLSHLMKLLHLMILSSQQFYLCDTLFNVHDTLMKHTLKLTLEISRGFVFQINP